MNINRHNYETFFLLYVDNELSGAEREFVEQFVQENTDLGMELQMLQEATLPGEAVLFHSKEQLLKAESGLDELQEHMLLHLDRELDKTAADKLTAAIGSSPVARQEWELLQQTKLDAGEQILFKDKAVLYRHEKGRVVPIRYWRVAVAAAIILGMLFTGIAVLRKSEAVKGPYVLNEGNPKAKESDNGIPVNNSPVNREADQAVSGIASNKGKSSTAPVAEVITGKGNRDDKDEPIDRNIAVKPREANKKMYLPRTPLENINKEGSNQIAASTVLNKKNRIVYVNQAPEEIVGTSIKEKVKAPATPLIDYNSVSATPDSYARTAALNEVPQNNNQIFYLDEERVTRSKVGGLFKKVKRVIERNTNIKTGNGVKIGGFEIALNK